MKKLLLIVFIVAALTHLISVLSGFTVVNQISKPLIMLTLIAYYSFAAGSERSLTVIFAMALSLLGDVLLISPSWFVEGLIAFLVSHVFYILAYRQHQDEPTENSLQGVHKVRLAFPIILAATGLVIVLYPMLGDLKVPVIVYAAVLAFMALQALFRYGRTNSSSFWMVFSGAILFMISDSTLAINKFLKPLDHAHFLIMLTYIAAQFLIVEGLLRHREEKSF